ncbi:HAMP domain-containing protein [Lentzea tibetensis]|uniref:histidine kinase n=1 Tax=Lentzea tibetensis TaxID=2591470 RepID=A0A563EGV8_9PSEU|nr:HAMP domain-containing protein [Lentzea tibetensis]TWP45755.1 HAMP domain-containing protein [Lentzea tibetensis]
MRRNVTQQVAEAGFPSGARVPLIVTMTTLVLLMAFCAIRLNGQQDGATIQVVARSHEWFADNLARSIGASVNEAVGDLTTAVKLYDVKPGRRNEQTIEFFAKNSPHTRGIAVVDRVSGGLLASAGEPVAIESLPIGDINEVSVRVVAGAHSGVQIVIADLLPGSDQLIVVSTELVVPATSVDALNLPETVLLSTSDGEVLRPRSATPVAGEPERSELVQRAATAAAAGTSGHLVGGSEPSADGRPTVPIVAFAPVATGNAKTRLGFSVLLVGATPEVADPPTSRGVLPLVTLTCVALLVLLLLGGALVRPVRRLRADALAIASGRLDQPVRTHRIDEVRRIAGAFERARRVQAGLPDEPPAARARLSARTAVVLAGVVLLVWASGVMVTLGRLEVQVPAQAVQITQSLATNTAAVLRRSLQQSLTDLRSFAALVTSTDPADLRPALDEITARNPRYRSVYVVDANGDIEARAGRTPLRPRQRPPRTRGLHQQNTSGRVPIVYASTPLADGQHVLIGELDVVKLAALVRQPGGIGRLVDGGLRTVAATVGYRAYEELTAEPLRRSVSKALHGESEPTVREVDGRMSVVASAAINGSSTTSELQWAVVIEQPVSRLPLPGNDVRRSAWLAALIAAVTVLCLLGWHLLVLVLPLRRLAATADRFAAGDRTTVIYPQRPDEIGTIARCLELCRQSVDRKGP